MTALLTAVLAFFGAGAGALFALNRFKKERAFDVRLEWYKRVIELLQKSVLEIRHLTQALRTQPQDEDVIETAYGRLTKAMEELHEMRALATLFADDTTFGAIQKAGARDRSKLVGPKGVFNLEALDMLCKYYQNAAITAAIQGRRHLGIEKLKALRSVEFPGPSSPTKKLP